MQSWRGLHFKIILQTTSHQKAVQPIYPFELFLCYYQEIHLSLVFILLASELLHFYNKRRNSTKVTVAATSILTLAIIMAASNMVVVTPRLATSTPLASQSGIELSSQPVYQTQEKLVARAR
jgi:hypothetical protein